MANILYDNCFISAYKTIVKEVVEENGLFWHYLEETIFYVESGGMESDEGLINQHKVIKLKKEYDKVWHLLNVKLEGTVNLSIDFHLRFNRAQIHTAQHLISGIMESVYGYQTTSHHIHDSYNDIEFDVEDLKDRQLHELQVIVNGLIRDDLRVGIFYPTKMEMPKYNIKNPGLYNEIRMVKIGDITQTPCGCIHVPSLRYVQMIKILGFEKSRKKVKIKYVCGDQLLNNFDSYHSALLKASTLLAQPFDFIEVGILKLMQENKSQQADIVLLKEKYCELMISTFNPNEKLVKVFNDMDLRTFMVLTSKYVNVSKENFIFMWHQESRMHLFVKTNDSEADFKEIATKFKLNGGGNSVSAQGGGVYHPEAEAMIIKILNKN